ncbi:unnamed protein product, partial [Discosporangium mesarthrocarpum]
GRGHPAHGDRWGQEQGQVRGEDRDAWGGERPGAASVRDGGKGRGYRRGADRDMLSSTARGQGRALGRDVSPYQRDRENFSGEGVRGHERGYDRGLERGREEFRDFAGEVRQKDRRERERDLDHRDGMGLRSSRGEREMGSPSMYASGDRGKARYLPSDLPPTRPAGDRHHRPMERDRGLGFDGPAPRERRPPEYSSREGGGEER